MEKQTPLSEIRERGLKQSQGSHEKEWMQVPKPHGEKCHDPARLDKIVKAWRERLGGLEQGQNQAQGQLQPHQSGQGGLACLSSWKKDKQNCNGN